MNRNSRNTRIAAAILVGAVALGATARAAGPECTAIFKSELLTTKTLAKATPESRALAAFILETPLLIKEKQVNGREEYVPMRDHQTLEAVMRLVKPVSSAPTYERGMDPADHLADAATPANVEDVFWVTASRHSVSIGGTAHEMRRRLLFEMVSTPFYFDYHTGFMRADGERGTAFKITRTRVELSTQFGQALDEFTAAVGPTLTKQVDALRKELRRKYGTDVISPLKKTARGTLETELLPGSSAEAVAEALSFLAK